ncbi:MAG: sulfotransferase [Hyphomonadaceae bacterium]|nr:sulfotransferase [Hyphomonadaceae bacterium]
MRFAPEALASAAQEAAGLQDFGGETFREGLAHYCHALEHEAKLNAIGQMAIPMGITGALANRLRVTNWIKRHPEVLDERIEAPFVIVGLFRAGTTLLSSLLAKDARHRPLYRWEASDSTPPPTLDGIASDPRIEATRTQMAMIDQINPRFRVVQGEEPDGPTECIVLTGQDFRSNVWEAMANAPSYGAWLANADHASAYAYHKRVLQVLQSGGVRGRWTLKAPSHALQLKALTDTYPDARLILLHRDPVTLAASVCSLITTLTGTFSDADHSRYIATHWIDILERCTNAVEAFRREHPRIQIVDVLYSDLARDPIAEIRRIYSAFGDSAEGQPLEAMRAHLAARPKHKFGAHAYTPEDFGLNPGELRERFKAYTDRYSVPQEYMGG